ncbi:MAG: hypothetical protein CYPHOPRED_004999 [Cyphobasidiales sp. Tagirdzhanova-0007]|nr:MAG: hypothetical protein CYPHOPRED_004999 [Cyphobasidiales sp. Tagirdzhanova-0007]
MDGQQPQQPGVRALGKRRAVSPGVAAENGAEQEQEQEQARKRARRSTSSPHPASAHRAGPSRCIISPTLPKSRTPSRTRTRTKTSSVSPTNPHVQLKPRQAKRSRPPSLPIHPEQYDIPPEAERIAPAASLDDLLRSRRGPPPSAARTDAQEGIRKSPNRFYSYDEAGEADDEEGLYHPGFDAARHYERQQHHDIEGQSFHSDRDARAHSPVVDLTDSPRASPSRALSGLITSLDTPPLVSETSLDTPTLAPAACDYSSTGQDPWSAIVIQDSPTPPLRPLASPQARLEASASGRCGVFRGGGSAPSPEKEEQKILLGELVCPICLGPPAPLVLTECGHAL